MQDDDFAAFFSAKAEEGCQRFAAMSRTLLSHFAPEWLAALESSGNEALLDPSLFAYFSAPDPRASLEQVLYGYLPDELRPTTVELYCDPNGVIYLPGLGYLKTEMSDDNVQLIGDPSSPSHQLRSRDGRTLDFTLVRLPVLPGTSISVLCHSTPLLQRLFRDLTGRHVDVEIDAISARQVDNAARALELMRRVCPWYYGALIATTKQLVIFHGDGMNSFADLAAHGIAFLNASESDDEVFLIEDLAHQCGHVALSAVMFEPHDYMRILPETPLHSLTGIHKDTRTVYVAFHGVFTEALMNMCLDRCLDVGDFSERQEHELVGRLCYILKRFEIDLAHFGQEPEAIFTDDGLRLYEFCVRTFDEVRSRRGQLLDRCDLSNQPYNFDYARFLERNPPSHVGTKPKAIDERVPTGERTHA